MASAPVGSRSSLWANMRGGDRKRLCRNAFVHLGEEMVFATLLGVAIATRPSRFYSSPKKRLRTPSSQGKSGPLKP